MLSVVTIVHSANRLSLTNILSGRNIELFNVKLGGVYDYHGFFFSVALRPNAGHGLLIREVS